MSLVHHFVGRGFTGKAMYVGLDKAAAVRMYDYVTEAWAEHLAELRVQHETLPELERPWLASRIQLSVPHRRVCQREPQPVFSPMNLRSVGRLNSVFMGGSSNIYSCPSN